jgi:hypothetical protein
MGLRFTMSAILPLTGVRTEQARRFAARLLGLGPVIVANFPRERARPVASLLFSLDRRGFQFGYGYRADAAALVRRMAGRYRLPDALRRADTPARTGPPPATMTDDQPD